MSQGAEIILAQEQGVMCKHTAIDLAGELQGTLVLTNQRLAFVSDDDKTEVSTRDEFGAFEPLTYTDIEDLAKVRVSERNVFIPLSSIANVSGHKGVLGRPGLKVTWNASNGLTRDEEFVETLTGRARKKNLNDWANVIERLRSGALVPHHIGNLPDNNSLESRVLYILGDMQTKGLLQIEQQTKEQFDVEIETDDVGNACEKLVSLGLIDKVSKPGDEEFYKKRSPLGEDDLSS
jgi:hypothetical protein